MPEYTFNLTLDADSEGAITTKVARENARIAELNIERAAEDPPIAPVALFTNQTWLMKQWENAVTSYTVQEITAEAEEVKIDFLKADKEKRDAILAEAKKVKA